jgi:Cu/Ag efflux protein CusF
MNVGIFKRAFVIGVIGSALLITVVGWATQRAEQLAETNDQGATTGRIKSVDQERRNVIVRDAAAEKAFDVAVDAAIVTKSNPKASLADLKVGDDATVMYHADGEKLVAQRIEVGEPNVGRIPDSPAPPVEAKQPGLSRHATLAPLAAGRTHKETTLRFVM